MYSSKPVTNKNTPKGKKNIDKRITFYLSEKFKLYNYNLMMKYNILLFDSKKEAERKRKKLAKVAELRCTYNLSRTFICQYIKLSSVL